MLPNRTRVTPPLTALDVAIREVRAKRQQMTTRTSVLTDKSFTFSPILMEGGENGEGSGRCDRTR